MRDLSPFNIENASRLLRARAISSVELTEMTLARLEMTEPRVHAYAYVTRDSALNTARRCDNEPHRGPLHGIPVGVKDVFCTDDAPTEAGSRILADFYAGEDAVAVRRLREGNAVLLGKHMMHEFAAGQNVPPTRNPWSIDRYPGGSTAGGGVSVAVGSSLAALGTDSAGSVRKPASATATVGVKPTYGRVSLRGTIRAASAPSLDHVGTLARTVKDAALVLQVICGFDPLDPRSVDRVVPDFTHDIESGIAGFRLGIAPSYFQGEELDPEVGDAIEKAIELFRRLGARIVRIELPALRLAATAGRTILLAEMFAAHRNWIVERRADYTDATRVMLELGLCLSDREVELAVRARDSIRDDVTETFHRERLHGLLTPTLPCQPMLTEEMVPAVDVPRMSRYTLPWNLTGQPALSLPCGFTGAGVPIGLQIVGRSFDESSVLRIGATYERETPWHRMLDSLLEPATL